MAAERLATEIVGYTADDVGVWMPFLRWFGFVAEPRSSQAREPLWHVIAVPIVVVASLVLADLLTGAWWTGLIVVISCAAVGGALLALAGVWKRRD